MEMKPGWHSMMTLCVICSHRWAAVFPNGADFTKLECPKAEAFHSMPLPKDDDDGDSAEAWKA